MENTTNGQSFHAGSSDNALAAGAAGVAIGATAAFATTRILSDKKMRDKIMTTAHDIRHKIAASIKHARDEMMEKKTAGKD